MKKVFLVGLVSLLHANSFANTGEIGIKGIGSSLCGNNIITYCKANTLEAFLCKGKSSWENYLVIAENGHLNYSRKVSRVTTRYSSSFVYEREKVSIEFAQRSGVNPGVLNQFGTKSSVNCEILQWIWD